MKSGEVVEAEERVIQLNTAYDMKKTLKDVKNEGLVNMKLRLNSPKESASLLQNSK